MDFCWWPIVEKNDLSKNNVSVGCAVGNELGSQKEISSEFSDALLIAEALWQLKVEDGQGATVDGQTNPYPDRPGEPDCIFYLRTGNCGYGSNCKYNHPSGQGVRYTGELPQREGQPDCQFFLKTGTCKFGASCKYHHPRDKHDGQPVQLNVLGLPLRKDEKSCSYYLRTGSCKFGIACKFNHPQPATFGSMVLATGPSVYGYTGSPTPSTGPPIIGGLTPWTYSRNPYISNPRMQGIPAYMPLVLPPNQGTMPLHQGWNMYMGGIGITSNDAIDQDHISNSKNYTQPGSSAVTFPERPDQPECQYYMKTGSCKYGSSCKYHHPREKIQAPAFTVGPHGLPLRPGESVCTFYTNYGTCKYGTACKYDHPVVGYYNYTLPSMSYPEPSAVLPNQRISQVMWTPSDDSPSNTMKTPNEVLKSGKSYEVHELNNSGHEDPSTPPSPAPHAVQPESPQNQLN